MAENRIVMKGVVVLAHLNEGREKIDLKFNFLLISTDFLLRTNQSLLVSILNFLILSFTRSI